MGCEMKCGVARLNALIPKEGSQFAPARDSALTAHSVSLSLSTSSSSCFSTGIRASAMPLPWDGAAPEAARHGSPTLRAEDNEAEEAAPSHETSESEYGTTRTLRQLCADAKLSTVCGGHAKADTCVGDTQIAPQIGSEY